jgi:ABC-type multidrug transport system ATPase subunit
VVFISHNREEIVNADYVIVMKDGRMAAAGTPKELKENSDYLALTALRDGEVPV